MAKFDAILHKLEKAVKQRGPGKIVLTFADGSKKFMFLRTRSDALEIWIAGLDLFDEIVNGRDGPLSQAQERARLRARWISKAVRIEPPCALWRWCAAIVRNADEELRNQKA